MYKKLLLLLGLLSISMYLGAGVSSASSPPPDDLLRAAVIAGDAAAVRDAARMGADVDLAIEREGITGEKSEVSAAGYALLPGNFFPEVVLALVQEGADVKTPLKLSRLEMPLLYLAILRMQQETDPASLETMTEAVGAMLDAGADVNSKNDMNDKDDPAAPHIEVFYAIHEAALIGAPEYAVRVSQMLLDRGADVETLSERGGMTPLMICSMWMTVTGPKDRSEVVRFFADRGADVNAVAAGGATALNAAILSPETTRTLLDLGARTDAGGSVESSPFREAVIHGDPECALIIYRHERAQRSK